MFNKSIAYRLSIYISLSVIGVFMSFIIIIFFYNKHVVTTSIENAANNLSMEAIGLVNRQLISTKEITNNLAEQILYYAEHDNAELILTSILDRYPYINSIYVSIDSFENLTSTNNHHFSILRNADSVVYKSSNEKIYTSVIEHEVYNKHEFGKSSFWSDAYQSSENTSQLIAYYSPIKIIQNNAQIIIGSVISELSLKSLNENINNIKIGENGYSFLMNKEGVYLTHPNKDWIFNKNIFSVSNRSYDQNETNVRNIFNKNLTGSLIAYPEYLNYEKSWVHYMPIMETEWYLLVLVPYDELYLPLSILIFRMIFLSVLGILIIFFIVAYISKKQIEPLSNVTTQLKRFSNLSDETELTTHNEVKLVADSLDSLKNWFEKYKDTQDQEKKLSKQQKQDLLEASEIQMSLINTDFSGFEKRNDIDLSAIYKPSRIVSGDLYDFFFLDNENLFFSVGDVSGKGVSAAFFMSVAQTIIKENSILKEPEKIVNQVNKYLTRANRHQFFLTLFIGVLNIKTGILKYCNAAHTSTIIIKESGEILKLNQSHGLPIGLYSDKVYANAVVKLEQNDLIYLYTDGVTELQNEDKDHFGKDQLITVLKSVASKSSKEIITSIEADLDNYRGANKQSDDITMMVIKYKAKKRPV